MEISKRTGNIRGLYRIFFIFSICITFCFCSFSFIASASIGTTSPQQVTASISEGHILTAYFPATVDTSHYGCTSGIGTSSSITYVYPYNTNGYWCGGNNYNLGGVSSFEIDLNTILTQQEWWSDFQPALNHTEYILFYNYSDLNGCSSGDICTWSGGRQFYISVQRLTGKVSYTETATSSWAIIGNPISETHFTLFDVSTSTQEVHISGHWNATTTPNIFEQLEFYQDDAILGIQSYTTTDATTTGDFDFYFEYRSVPSPVGATTTSQITAQQHFYANLYQIDQNLDYDPFTGLIDPNYQILLDATSTSILATSTDLTDIFGVLNYPEYECSITSLTGCIKNALIWTFYPTASTLNKLVDFYDLIQVKPPVGYFSVVKNNLNNLSATGTPEFSITIPIHLKNYIFDPFDQGISAIFGFFFIINFYKRLKHITI